MVVSTITYAKSKNINGRIYKSYLHCSTKQEAEYEAKKLRTMPYYVRIIKETYTKKELSKTDANTARILSGRSYYLVYVSHKW